MLQGRQRGRTDRSFCDTAGVPKLPKAPGAIGLALTAFDLYRRLPPRHRRMILQGARRYGPLIATQAARSARAAAARRQPRG